MSEATRDSRCAGTVNVVLQEIWRAKDALGARYDHDLDKLAAAMRERQKRSGHRVVSFQKRSERSASRQER
jgi:hypothetical protein